MKVGRRRVVDAPGSGPGAGADAASHAGAPLRQPKVTVDALPNGVRVAVAELPHIARAHVTVLLRGGPVHETDATWGMSHLVEHMIFRGTDLHAGVGALTLAADDFGGDIGAMTYRDRVVFDTRCDPGRLDEAFALFAAMIAAPRFTGLAVERGIVEEEIAELFDDDGNEVDIDNAVCARVFSGHPLARSIEGTPEHLARFDLRALRAFHGTHYRGGNVVVAVAGPNDARQVIERVKRAFGRVPAGAPPSLGKPPEAPKRKPVVVIPTDAAQTQVRLCAPLPGFADPERTAIAQALVRILDDGPASRLQARVVDRDGLAYSVWAFADVYEDRGVLEVGGTVRHDRVGELVEALCRELGAMRRKPRPAEIARVAARYRRDMRDGLDDPAALSESLAKGLLFDVPFRPRQATRRLATVTPDEVAALARASLQPERLQLVLAGSPTKRELGQARRAFEALARRAAH